MQSSRDSSFWRSLAVALGDGLAFAVGMKLAQAAGRLLAQPQPCAARSGATPSTDRVEQIEQNSERIERVELGPVSASEAVNRNVPEAIVDALEARLAEHAGMVERRV